MRINRQWRIARRPVGLARPSDFEWREEPVPSPGPGQILVRNQYLFVEPTLRVWMRQEDADFPAQALGTVVRGFSLGMVEQSLHPAYSEGALLIGALGWQDYALADAAADYLIPLPLTPEISIEARLGLLGHAGIAAYFGLLQIGRPIEGDTLVVSSAAGAVGSLVGQIGKLHGCHVVGIAGTAEKCRWIRDELGFDAAINYKTEPVFKRLQECCPRGIDVYFDNIGGAVLEDVLHLINMHARIVICGMLALYNDVGGSLTLPAGPNNLMNLMARCACMKGFLGWGFRNRASEAHDSLLAWHRAGKLRYRLNVVEGLRNAPAAMGRLFDGSNSGKLVVRVA